MIESVSDALKSLFPQQRELELRGLWEKREGEKRGKIKVLRSADRALLATNATRWDEGGAKGIYVVMNPFGEVSGKAVQDGDVTAREWFLIDIDAVRDSGTSSTKQELRATLKVAAKICQWLGGLGWPRPFIVESGNGSHIMWRTVLGTTDEETSLIQRCLEALAWKFDTEAATIDQTVFNLSRIWRLPGTTSRKGAESTEDRPWRRSRVRRHGEETPVTKEQLQQLADSIDIGEAQDNDNAELGRLRSWLHANWSSVGEPRPYLGGAGRRWIFPVCPWDSSHCDRSAYVIRFATGAIIAGCLHTSCEGHRRDDSGKSLGWKQLQKLADRPFQRVTSSTGVAASSVNAPHKTNLGNVMRLVRNHGSDLKYVPQWGEWLAWDGTRWHPSPGHAERIAMGLSAIIFAEAAGATDADEAKALRQWAIRSESTQGILGTIRLAQSSSTFMVPAESMDADNWSLNCANGILDLRTGKMSAHRKDALMTQVSQIAHREESECPRWLEFLDTIFNGNRALIDFIQRSLGYCLTGSVQEQVMFLCHGGGSNGKTTFVRVVQHILADYATQIDSNILMTSKGEQHPTGLTDLKGKRFAGAAESDRGRQLAEAMIKQLTGDDIITARRMRKDYIRFMPTHKLWLLVNHKPIIKGNDEGIWRRLMYVPFTVTIQEEQKDRDLLQKLQGEAEGIFRWMVEGCLQWQQQGLNPPRIVRDEVESYRDDMDLLKDFFEEVCTIAPGLRVTKRELFESYKEWCEPLNNKAGNIKYFGRLMMERGFKGEVAKVKDAAGLRRSVHIWKGIKVGVVQGTVVEVDFVRS